jgi:hypothetical protein
MWQELSECDDYWVWIAQVPWYVAPTKRQDCFKWTEVVFGSFERLHPEKKGTEIINAELASVFEKLLDEQQGRHLRWEEIEGPITDDMVEIIDSSRNYALTRALGEGRLRFTREEFEENFHFSLPTKFSYNCYMNVGEKYFRPRKLLRVDFTTAQLKNKVTSPEAKDILAQKPKEFDYIKVGKTYFTPIRSDTGHGATWKYHCYETGNFKADTGQVLELKVKKPITGISSYYRCFVLLVIASKVAIAIALGIYGGGLILFVDQDTGSMILNTLSSLFIFTVDDIVYVATTSKQVKAITNPELHTISFCEREPIRNNSAPQNLYFNIGAMLAIALITIVFNFGWGCVDE